MIAACNFYGIVIRVFQAEIVIGISCIDTADFCQIRTDLKGLDPLILRLQVI